MAKISTQMGPSDSSQPGEPLHLLQAEIVPGSQPEKANEATTRAVGEASEEFTPSDGGFLSPEEEERRRLVEESTGGDEEDEDEDDEERDSEELDGDDLDEERTGDERNEELVNETVAPATPPLVISTAPYDPSAHTVAEVNAYLDSLDRDGDEYNAILEKESSVEGKGRLGILTGRI
jgi:hypothetical protein